MTNPIVKSVHLEGDDDAPCSGLVASVSLERICGLLQRNGELYPNERVRVVMVKTHDDYGYLKLYIEKQ